jgi:cyclic pyranopterin phosphate synthase
MNPGAPGANPEAPGRRAGTRTAGAADSSSFSHVDASGRARMVDVTAKAVTERHATARCVLRASPGALEAAVKDEDLSPFARAAGIQGAKQAFALIPLCHPLPLDEIEIDVAFDVPNGRVDVRASTAVVARTGVEIEALTACACTGLTLLMALRNDDQDAVLTTLSLWHKSGGRSGTWERPGASGVSEARSSSVRP